MAKKRKSKKMNLKTWDEIAEKLSETESKTDRFALFLGLFSEEYFTRTGMFPILVGGGAVEIFTQGGYSTGDLDLLCDLDVAGDILRQWGFSSCDDFRGFIQPDDDLYVEILGAHEVNDDPEAMERVEAIVLDDNKKFFIIALEDLIIDRIRACVYWKHTESGIWARVMMKIGLETDEPIDLDYIRKKLSDSGEGEALRMFEEELNQLPNQKSDEEDLPF